MEVTPPNSVTQPAQPAAALPTPPTSLDYNAFLKLLIAQLQNQDPLNPMDGTEYTAQLAQFSGVEQSIQTNQKLDSLMASFSLSQADSLIGRTVTSADGSVSGIVTSINIISSGSIAQLQDGTRLPLGAGITIS